MNFAVYACLWQFPLLHLSWVLATPRKTKLWHTLNDKKNGSILVLHIPNRNYITLYKKKFFFRWSIFLYSPCPNLEGMKDNKFWTLMISQDCRFVCTNCQHTSWRRVHGCMQLLRVQGRCHARRLHVWPRVGRVKSPWPGRLYASSCCLAIIHVEELFRPVSVFPLFSILILFGIC